MVNLSARFFALVVVFASVVATLATPVKRTLSIRTNHTTSADPHWVAYWDEWVSGETGPPSVSTVQGFDVMILSFLLSSGAADQAEEWVQIGEAARSSVKAQYNNAGIRLLVSAFGSTDTPTSLDPTSLASKMASWVKTYDLDGIDVDYEDFKAIAAGTAVDWLITFTTVLRQMLPAEQYIITHAPIAPWFSASTGSPYLTVDAKVGDMIDWYNVQFYNQDNSYTTCSTIVTKSGDPWPKSSIFEIAAAGVPLNKIVLGKPAKSGDAGSGYVDPGTLATCVQQAKNAGWSAGVMVWQYPHAGSSWISIVRSKSWPM